MNASPALIRNPLHPDYRPFEDGSINAAHLFWLPPDSPFGNLTLKVLVVAARFGHLNRRIDWLHVTWREATKPGGVIEQSSSFVAEEVVHHLRRGADELLSTWFLLQETSVSGAYPEKLPVDMLGRALDADRLADFKQHEFFFRTLNDVSNAQKHSFLHSEAVAIHGRDVCCVAAIKWPYGDQSNQPQLYVVALDDLVEAMNEFLVDVYTKLREVGEALRQD